MGNVHPRLRNLNTVSPVGSAVWEVMASLGHVAFLEEVHHWRKALRILTSLHFQFALWFVFAIDDEALGLLLLPAGLLCATTLLHYGGLLSF